MRAQGAGRRLLMASLVLLGCTSSEARRPEANKREAKTVVGQGSQDEMIVDAGIKPAPGAELDPLAQTVLLRVQSLFMGEGCRGNFRCQVHEDGRVYLAENQRGDCPPGQAFDTPYPAQPTKVLAPAALLRLRAVINEKLPALQAGYRPKGKVFDGAMRILEVRAPGGVKRVIADRTKPPAFEAIIDALWKELY